MKNITKKQTIQTILGALLLSAAMHVTAVPITGGIGMGGNFIAVDSSWNATGMASATGINFDPNLFIVNSKTGSFTAVSSMLGNITDFQFDPLLGSIASFWSVDGFSFELTAVTRGFTSDPDRFLILEGTGILSAAGFDDTPATMIFTGNTVNNSVFSWSAGFRADAMVPEPGMLALLAAGLIGFAGRKQIISRK